MNTTVNNKANIMREDKKKQLLEFIERKKNRVIHSEKAKILMQENKNENVPPENKTIVRQNIDKTHIEGSNRRKKRREKLQTNKEKKEAIKKKHALAVQEIKQKKEEERKKRKETQQQKKLEALKKREEERLLKEAKKKEILEKKKEAIRNKKEARLLQEARIKEEREQKKVEAVKKQEERRQIQKAKKKEKTTVATPSVITISDSSQTKRKEALLEFIKTRKTLNEQQRERKKILKQIAIEKAKGAAPQEQPEKIKKVVPMPVISSVIPASVRTKLSKLSKESRKTEVDAKDTLVQSVSNTKKFISNFEKKKEPIKRPISVTQDKQSAIKYREPFLLVPFIKRNIFKFVFLILLIGWLGQISFFMNRLRDPQQRLLLIVGADIARERNIVPDALPVEEPEEQLPVTDAEFQIALKRERINIEGKRDPFSPGQLSMEVITRPRATNIVFAARPAVISILRPQRPVGIIQEEKRLEPEKVSPVTKPPTPPHRPIVRDPIPPRLQPEPVEVTPLIRPEKQVDLIYRGRLVIEGIEYLFIEGRHRTYRVTIGDVVEGFRILRKEQDKLYLSRDGIIYEIPVH